MNESFGKLIEPEPVPFSFGAPGWYVVGVLIIMGLCIAGYLIYLNHKRNRYRKAALRFLSEIERELSAKNEFVTLLYEHNMMMKRIEMTLFQRDKTASLRGDEWISFLNNTMRKQLFAADDMQLLNAALYQSSSVNQEIAKKFISNTKQWIRQHKRSAKIETHGTRNAL